MQKPFIIKIIIICFLTIYSFNFAEGAEKGTEESKNHRHSLNENKNDTVNTDKYNSLESLFYLYQPYIGNISAYEPMYFLFGTKPEESKFQFSFKYRFFNPEGSFSKRYSWMKGFHFAYTQTSFWDLKSVSKPFEDTSYRPELFFLSPNIYPSTDRIIRLFLQTGYMHESNGRSEDASRSTNYLYLKPICIIYSEKKMYGLQIAPKFWTYLKNENDTNRDLKDYRGFVDLELKFGKADSFVIETHYRYAKEGSSIWVDISYPLNKFLLDNLDLYLQAEYVNCLAESLLHYQKRSESFRIGFAIIR